MEEGSQQDQHKSSRNQRLKAGWYERSLEAYEEGGAAIGRFLCYHPEKEDYLWGLIGGTGVWPKWYLTAFKYHWLRRNRDEYNRIKVARYDRRKSRQKKNAKLRAAREQAMAKLPAPQSKASKDAGNEI